jgi:O-methyltransferase
MRPFYLPAPFLVGHPYWPERLGYLKLLRVLRPSLANLIDKVKPNTLMSARKLTTLYREGRRTLLHRVPGDFVEIGVHRGGSAAILAALLKDRPERHLHLFDRWGDLPEPTERDGFRQEEYRRERIPDKLASLTADPPLHGAQQLLETAMQFQRERLHYYPGWYSETFSHYAGRLIAFASLDCDYYESMHDALEFVDRYAAGRATIVADDYGSWPGVKAAVDDWLALTKRKVRFYPLRIGAAILRLDGR